VAEVTLRERRLGNRLEQVEQGAGVRGSVRGGRLDQHLDCFDESARSIVDEGLERLSKAFSRPLEGSHVVVGIEGPSARQALV
jgi:hypothetical protein